jgi:hypothetical protein
MTRDEWQQQAVVILREQHDIRPIDIRYSEWRNAYMLHGTDIEAGAQYMAKTWLNRQSAATRKHYRARART